MQELSRLSPAQYRKQVHGDPRIEVMGFVPHTLIYKAGDPASHLYLVTNGAVGIYQDKFSYLKLKKLRLGIEVVEAPGFLGEAALRPFPVQNTTAVALAPCEVIAFPREHLQILMVENPILAMEIIEAMARRLTIFQDRYFIQAAGSTPQNTAYALSQLPKDRNGRIKADISQIAQWAGRTTEKVGKALRNFKDEDLIMFGYHPAGFVRRVADGFRVLDENSLKAMIRPAEKYQRSR